MTPDPLADIRARCRELIAARRLKRPAVAWVCPELQAERMAAMLDALAEADLESLRRREASGEAAEARAICAAVEAHEAAATEAERVRVVAAYSQHAAEGRDPARGGEPLSVLARASLWLAAVPGATSGQGRDSQLWKACGVGCKFALEEAVAVELVLAEYAPRCSPMPTRADVRGKVRRALRDGGRYGAALARK